MSLPSLAPDDALRTLAQQLRCVEIESGCQQCSGRVLAADVVADRDSPAANVSAMDGYAIRMSDLQSDVNIPIRGESAAGQPPPPMIPQGVVRIFTGAVVPAEAQAVIKREDTDELNTENIGAAIRLRPAALQTQPGDHIRWAGENAKAGSSVLTAGTRVTAAQQATMINFGCFQTDLFRRVRVTIVTTGDEVGLFRDTPPQPWQLRNSNQLALQSLLQPIPWIDVVNLDHGRDDRTALAELLATRLQHSDAILLTGGVSMGDYDHVPDAVRDVGGKVVFHGLPIRPGKPILGAATDDGKLILGLPGNPVSAVIGARRMALPLLAKLSGQTDWLPSPATVQLQGSGGKTLPLHWLRLVRMIDKGIAEVVPSQGSGDLVSLGRSSGFVELPPGASGSGPWPYHEWGSRQ